MGRNLFILFIEDVVDSSIRLRDPNDDIVRIVQPSHSHSRVKRTRRGVLGWLHKLVLALHAIGLLELSRLTGRTHHVQLLFLKVTSFSSNPYSHLNMTQHHGCPPAFLTVIRDQRKSVRVI